MIELFPFPNVPGMPPLLISLSPKPTSPSTPATHFGAICQLYPADRRPCIAALKNALGVVVESGAKAPPNIWVVAHDDCDQRSAIAAPRYAPVQLYATAGAALALT